MTCQSEGLARVRARVTQGFVQGFSRSFLQLCKGCKGSAYPCLTYMCARARLRMRVGLHKTLATLATLAHSKPLSFFYSHLAVRDCARVTQGLGVPCKGLTLASVFALRSSSRVRRASGTDGQTSGGWGAAGRRLAPPPPGGGRFWGRGRRPRPLSSTRRDFFSPGRIFRGRCCRDRLAKPRRTRWGDESCARPPSIATALPDALPSVCERDCRWKA